MQIHTTVRSPGAMLLAAAFFCVTSYVLFHDVWNGAEITTDHVMTMAVLIGTIASGHMVWAQARQWRLFPAIGLALLFVVGTVYCVTASAGRNALASIEKGLDAHKVNDDRKRLEIDIASAKTRVKEAEDAEAQECGSGDGPRCKARRTTREERQTYLNVLEAQLRLMAPEQPEHADIKHTAKVFARLPWVKANPDEIEGSLLLFLPFFKAAFAEVATIVFASIALGHKVAPRLAPRVVMPETDPAPRNPTPGNGSPRETLGNRRRPGNPGKPSAKVYRFPGNRPTATVSKVAARAWLTAELERNGCLPSQDTMADVLSLHKGTVAKWMDEWETEGLIARETVGRCKVVRLASVADAAVK